MHLPILLHMLFSAYFVIINVKNNTGIKDKKNVIFKYERTVTSFGAGWDHQSYIVTNVYRSFALIVRVNISFKMVVLIKTSSNFFANRAVNTSPKMP